MQRFSGPAHAARVDMGHGHVAGKILQNTQSLVSEPATLVLVPRYFLLSVLSASEVC